MSGPQRPPDFFIVGQPKSGTTALYEMLRQHPQIFMPDLKEPMFLCSDFRPRFNRPGRDGPPASMTDYLQLFAPGAPEQLLGEASALYLLSTMAAGAIAELNPRARVIAIFREPAAFLRSFHMQLRQEHQENRRDLRKAMALEPARDGGRHIPRRAHRPQDLRYSQHVRYTAQLQRLHAVLPRDQVLALVYDDYRTDNAGTVNQVLEFLEVDCSIALEPLEANPSVEVRSQIVDDALHRFSVGRGPFSRAVKAGIKTVISETQRRRLLHALQTKVVYARPGAPDEDTAAVLRRWLKPEVERFGEYMERDLVSLWGYDGV